jgi:hypothetical protein
VLSQFIPWVHKWTRNISLTPFNAAKTTFAWERASGYQGAKAREEKQRKKSTDKREVTRRAQAWATNND